MLNAIDLIAAIVFLLFILTGYRVGLWAIVVRLVALLAGVYLALLWYAPLGAYIQTRFSTATLLSSVIAFILIMVVTQEVLSALLHFLIRSFPKVFFENVFTRTIAILPAAFEGALLIVLFITATVVLPLPTNIAQEISSSYLSTQINAHESQIEGTLDSLTGGNLSKALSLFTSGTEGEGSTPLPFKPNSTSIDEAGELQLLALVNQERTSRGIAPLTLDTTLTAVARAHSQDMWARQYFAHNTPDGLTPFDRMHATGITYVTAGENLALAPSVQSAHTGLMNSPGHKANILDPDFHKVGIGIIDGGIYGKMVTQDFTN